MPAFTVTTLFSPRIDFAEHWHERLEWLTDVQTTENDSECRVALRSKPRRTIRYTAKSRGHAAFAAREAALLESLIWGIQPTPNRVPLWADAVRIGAPATAGALSVSIDTTRGGTLTREFTVGGTVAFWRDPFTWELQTITSVATGTLGVAGLTRSWPLGTIVMPAALATMDPSIAGHRPSALIGAAEMLFSCDVLADTAMSQALNPDTPPAVPFPPAINPAYGTVSFYNSFLAWRDTGRSAPRRTMRRTMVKMESSSGVFDYYAPSALPVWTHTADLMLKGRQNIQEFKGVLLQCAGRAYPFWTPTWAKDFTLAAPALSSDTTLTVQSEGYAAYVFPNNPARRLIGIIDPGIHAPPLAIANAVDNGNGTETLTLSGAVGVAIPAATILSYIVLVRLDSDAVELEWFTTELARVSLGMSEIPREAGVFPVPTANVV